MSGIGITMDLEAGGELRRSARTRKVKSRPPVRDASRAPAPPTYEAIEQSVGPDYVAPPELHAAEGSAPPSGPANGPDVMASYMQDLEEVLRELPPEELVLFLGEAKRKAIHFGKRPAASYPAMEEGALPPSGATEEAHEAPGQVEDITGNMARRRSARQKLGRPPGGGS